MGMPRVFSCCFCLSLETGTLIIGYLYTILALLEVTIFTSIVSLRPVSPEGLTRAQFVFYTTLAVVSVLQLFIGVLLIVGTTMRKPSLTLPWTIVTGMKATLFIVLSVTAAAMLQDSLGASEETGMVVVYFVRGCIALYCVMVVHNRHKEIMNFTDERRFLHSAKLIPKSAVYVPVSTAQTYIEGS